MIGRNDRGNKSGSWLDGAKLILLLLVLLLLVFLLLVFLLLVLLLGWHGPPRQRDIGFLSVLERSLERGGI